MSRAGARQWGRAMRTSPVSPMPCAATSTLMGTSGSSSCRIATVSASSQGSTANTHSIERPGDLSVWTYSRYSSARGSGRSLARKSPKSAGVESEGSSTAPWTALSRAVPATSSPVGNGPRLRVMRAPLPQRGFRDEAEHEEIPAQGEPEAGGGRQDERVGFDGMRPGDERRGGTGEDQPEHAGRQGPRTEEQQRPLAKRADHPDRHEIEKHLSDPREPVLAPPQPAGMGPDLHLHDPGAGGGGRQRVDEAMEVGIQGEPVDELASIRLERAPGVPDRNAADPAKDAVGHPRRELAAQERVLAAPPITRNQIVPLPELRHQRGDIRRVVLEVAIHADDDLPPGMIESGLERGGLSIVLGQRDQADPLVGGGDREDGLRGPVAAPVVDEDQLPRRPRPHGCPDARHQGGDVRLLVEDRDDDGYRRRVGHSAPLSNGVPPPAEGNLPIRRSCR